MYKLTCSLKNWLIKYHKDLYVPISFGHVELLTQELQEDYVKWCKTEERKSYLYGGENYQAVN